jgi:hypothetical protein
LGLLRESEQTVREQWEKKVNGTPGGGEGNFKSGTMEGGSFNEVDGK